MHFVTSPPQSTCHFNPCSIGWQVSNYLKWKIKWKITSSLLQVLCNVVHGSSPALFYEPLPGLPKCVAKVSHLHPCLQGPWCSPIFYSNIEDAHNPRLHLIKLACSSDGKRHTPPQQSQNHKCVIDTCSAERQWNLCTLN